MRVKNVAVPISAKECIEPHFLVCTLKTAE